MNYNTQRPQLALPEYGRNVQNMIQFAVGLSTKEERNAAARAIIEVMGQLNPQLRDVEDFRHKLWTHLLIMSDYKLDVDSPYEIPQKEKLTEKPNRVKYPSGHITYGHYGKYTESVIHEIAQIENEKDRLFYKNEIADFMKKQFLTYNNKAVENQVIASQLEELSKGALRLKNPDSLTQTNQLLKSMGLNNINNVNNPKKKSKNTKKKFRKRS